MLSLESSEVPVQPMQSSSAFVEDLLALLPLATLDGVSLGVADHCNLFADSLLPFSSVHSSPMVSFTPGVDSTSLSETLVFELWSLLATSLKHLESASKSSLDLAINLTSISEPPVSWSFQLNRLGWFLPSEADLFRDGDFLGLLLREEDLFV